LNNNQSLYWRSRETKQPSKSNNAERIESIHPVVSILELKYYLLN
jgi:hypothetical protein